MAKIEARSPATGETIREYEETGADEIQRIMDRARRAFASWGRTSVKERVAYMKSLKRVILHDMDEVVRWITADTGKVDLEALSSDVLATLGMMQYYQDHAGEILKTEERPVPVLFMGARCYVEYRPMGVIAVFSPWNFPFQLAMIPIVSALTAGNTVIVKPSEITPTVGELIETLCSRAGLPRNVVQIVYGGRNAGQSLIKAMPDKIFFTGSLATGRKVMKAAAAGPIPVELELSGKDPMIVFADANFKRAVNAAVYGAFANSGQICVSIERCYVEKKVYEDFVEAVVEATKKLRVGQGAEADLGAITSPAQTAIIDDHVNDAIEKGARLLCGGALEGSFYKPMVLRDVTHDMKIMREETFGPVLPIMPFSTEDEAVRLANDSEYGLNAAVFTRDLKKARRVAGRIETGSCAVNDVVVNIANPFAPFGGVKRSGFGRYHGPEGLHAFSNQVSILVESGRFKTQPYYFPYSEKKKKIVHKLIKLLYGLR
jgi:acyl-CoA reductase-like NAD-dependent aldehyde dehydrogenase